MSSLINIEIGCVLRKVISEYVHSKVMISDCKVESNENTRFTGHTLNSSHLKEYRPNQQPITRDCSLAFAVCTVNSPMRR